MEEVGGHGYKGHLIITSSYPAPGDMFYGTFQIYRIDEASPRNRPRVHQQEKSGDFVFRTAHQATQESTKRAEAWIDANVE